MSSKVEANWRGSWPGHKAPHRRCGQMVSYDQGRFIEQVCGDLRRLNLQIAEARQFIQPASCRWKKVYHQLHHLVCQIGSIRRSVAKLRWKEAETKLGYLLAWIEEQYLLWQTHANLLWDWRDELLMIASRFRQGWSTRLFDPVGMIRVDGSRRGDEAMPAVSLIDWRGYVSDEIWLSGLA